MCRLFGFRSVILSQVHTSLVEADNALQGQGTSHPDGWGVSYYVQGSPHIVKSSTSALGDSIFRKVSGVVSSNTVVAHIRKATHGELNILNTHPFQYGNWVFAHNGNIKNFNTHKSEILNHISPPLRRFILGSTDSEVLFYFLLSHIGKEVDLSKKNCPVNILADASREALKTLVNIIGPYSKDPNMGEAETYLTFILTNGHTMLSYQGGKELYYSTYKKRCPDRDVCPSFDKVCEAPANNGPINHLIFSSEPLSGENIWIEMTPGQMIGVDADMKLEIFDTISQPALP